MLGAHLQQRRPWAGAVLILSCTVAMAAVTAQRETEMYGERQRQAAQPLGGQCPLALVPGYIVGPSSYRNLPGCDSVAACCALCSQDRACAAFTYDSVEYCREADRDRHREAPHTHAQTGPGKEREGETD